MSNLNRNSKIPLYWHIERLQRIIGVPYNQQFLSNRVAFSATYGSLIHLRAVTLSQGYLLIKEFRKR